MEIPQKLKFLYVAHSKISICILERGLRTAGPREHYAVDSLSH